MQKIALFVGLLAAFLYYLTFGPPNKFLIDVDPISYRSVMLVYNVFHLVLLHTKDKLSTGSELKEAISRVP